MKIKVDENLPYSVAELLRDRGFEADTVKEEGLGGTSDPQLLEVTTAEERMILTLDRGFGDIRAYPPGTHAGIVVLRLEDESAPSAAAAVTELIDHHDMRDLQGTITVLHRGTLRVRRPS